MAPQNSKLKQLREQFTQEFREVAARWGLAADPPVSQALAQAAETGTPPDLTGVTERTLEGIEEVRLVVNSFAAKTPTSLRRNPEKLRQFLVGIVANVLGPEKAVAYELAVRMMPVSSPLKDRIQRATTLALPIMAPDWTAAIRCTGRERRPRHQVDVPAHRRPSSSAHTRRTSPLAGNGLPAEDRAKAERRLAQMLNVDSFRLTGWGFGGFVGWIGGQETHVPADEWSEKKLGEKAGKGVKNPLAPLLWAWRHGTTEPERRTGKILSNSLRFAQPMQGSLSFRSDEIPLLGQQQPQPQVQRELSGLERPESLIIPVLPLKVAGVSTVGRGAGITPRLWFGAQLGLPINRRDGREVRIRFTLREVVEWLWPNGWKPSRNLPQLQQGLAGLASNGDYP